MSHWNIAAVKAGRRCASWFAASNREVVIYPGAPACFVLDLEPPACPRRWCIIGYRLFRRSGARREIALDEFAALLLDAMPDDFMPLEAP